MLLAEQASPTPAPPKLVLVLAIDQMRFDYLTRFADLYKGGIRRLITEGAVFNNAKYRHAATETGPGHSVILSGRHPSNSGIVANDWWDQFLDREITVVDDPIQAPLGGPGRSASPANFLGYTVGDVLKLKNPNSKVLGISTKDRSAILMAGRRADAAYWFELEGGNYITSTYYMPKAPAWLTSFNAQRLPDAYYKQGWTLLHDRALYERYAGKDDQPGEGYTNRNIHVPKPFPAAPPATAYYTEFRRTPYAEEVMLQFVFAAMKAHDIGADAVTDILALSFSSTDYVGHDYGPHSQEAMDQTLRLDRALDQLFQHIERTVGMANTIVAVTADHGVVPLPEILQQRGIDGRRADRQELLRAVEQALSQKFPGVEKLIRKTDFDIYSMYFDENLIRLNGLSLREIEETAAKAIMSTGFVDRVYTRSELMEQAPSSDPYMQLYRNSFYAPRSGHLTFLPKPYLTFWVKGTSHGTPYDHDRHVPIIFMGRSIKPGTYSEACGPEDIAPTLAHILGLDYPKEPDARLLLEMLK